MISFNDALASYPNLCENNIHFDASQAKAVLLIGGKTVHLDLSMLEALNFLCDNISTPLSLDTNSSMIISDEAATTNHSSCSALLKRIDNASALIRTTNATAQRCHDAWKTYEQAQSKTSSLEHQLEHQTLNCHGAYAIKPALIGDLQNEIVTLQCELTHINHQFSCAESTYSPVIMDAFESFIKAYRSYESSSATYKIKKRQYDKDLKDYEQWNRLEAQESRQRIRDQNQERIAQIRDQLSTLNQEIHAAITTSGDKATAGSGYAILNLKTQRTKMESEIQQLERAMQPTSRAKPLPPKEPVIPTLPDGALGLFGQIGINAMITAFEQKKSSRAEHLSHLKSQITAIQSSVAKKQSLIDQLNQVTWQDTSSMHPEIPRFQMQSSHEATAKAFLDAFSEHRKLTNLLAGYRSTPRPTTPRPINWPSEPRKEPLPQHNIRFSKIVLHFDKHACLKKVKAKHNPWSLSDKRGYSMRIIFNTALLALCSYAWQHAWRNLWLWAIFTMYNPASWVMAIDITMTIIAAAGVGLFFRQINAASAQSTYDYINESILRLASPEHTQETAQSGWFGFQFLARWQLLSVNQNHSGNHLHPYPSDDVATRPIPGNDSGISPSTRSSYPAASSSIA